MSKSNNPLRAVMDTNVLVAALRSRRGASFELLQLLRAGKWKLVLGNTVLAEYEEILKREAPALGLTLEEADKFLDALCLLVEEQQLSGNWTPRLGDPDDEVFLQLASESKSDYLLTHNRRHFAPAAELGIKVIAPKDFLSILRTVK